MIKKPVKIYLSLIITAVFCMPVLGGNTGAAFLKISPDAQGSGMGGAYTALADGVNAVWWNPGGLASVKDRELTGSHVNWVAGLSYDFMGYAHKIDSGVISAGVSVLDAGALESRDEYGNKGNDFNARDLSVSMAYAKKFANRTGVGLSLKYIKQTIASESAEGVCVDIGGITPLRFEGLSLGYGVYNLGPDMKFMNEKYHLPLKLAVGLGYSFSGMRLALDMNRDYYGKKTDFSIGTEYAPGGIISMRLGYFQNALKASNNEMGSTSNIIGNNGLRAGFGVMIFKNRLDYAFVPYGELGSTHRISITTSFPR